jgi:hypothetical protein
MRVSDGTGATTAGGRDPFRKVLAYRLWAICLLAAAGGGFAALVTGMDLPVPAASLLLAVGGLVVSGVALFEHSDEILSAAFAQIGESEGTQLAGGATGVTREEPSFLSELFSGGGEVGGFGGADCGGGGGC